MAKKEIRELMEAGKFNKGNSLCSTFSRVVCEELPRFAIHNPYKEEQSFNTGCYLR